MTRSHITLFVSITLVMATAVPALAQTKPGSKPSAKRPKEFLVGGLLAGPTPLGSAQAQLLNGSGDPAVTLFREENRLAIGFGTEASIGLQVRKALWVEINGSWTRASVQTDISADFENAPDETITSVMSRFAVGGAVLRYFHDKGPNAWFLRGAAGWMRETAGGNTLTGDGLIAAAGLGHRHWWRTNGKGAVKRAGLRFEGRVDIRSGGISIGDSGIRFGPAGAVHLVLGF